MSTPIITLIFFNSEKSPALVEPVRSDYDFAPPPPFRSARYRSALESLGSAMEATANADKLFLTYRTLRRSAPGGDAYVALDME